MDRPAMPEDLTQLDDDALTTLETELAAASEAAAAATPGELSDDDIAAIDSLADDVAQVAAERTRRAQAAANQVARTNRAAAALDRLAVSHEAAADATDVVDTDPADSDTGATTQPAAPAGGTGGGDGAGEPVELAQGDDDSDDDDVPPVTSSAGTVTSPQGRPVGRQLSTSLTQRLPAPATPRRLPAGAPMTTTPHVMEVPGFTPSQRLDGPAEIARLITEKRRRFGVIPAGTREFISLATGRKEIETSIGEDPAENFGALEAVRDQHRALVASGAFESHDTLVASGGCCAPCTPLYDFFRLAVPMTPIEDSLPVVEAPRGCIRLMGCTDWRVALSGITTVTCDENLAGKEKACVTFSCPPVQECATEAVAQCARFDNLQYRVFPEMVEQFLRDLAVAYSAVKEATYLTCFNANSTLVSGLTSGSVADLPYGAFRSVLDFVTRLAVRYRHRQAMPNEADLLLYLPSWVRDAMATDLVNNGECCSEENAYLKVDREFRERNLTVIWWRDLSTLAGHPAQLQPGSQEALAWPRVVEGYLFAPGTFIRLDGGSLDVGIVRDSTLNRTNDLEIFMEEWLGCCTPGCESIRFALEICPNGAGSLNVPPFACT